MQRVVETYITEARLGWYVRTGAKFQRDGNTWFWLSKDHRCDGNLCQIHILEIVWMKKQKQPQPSLAEVILPLSLV